MSLKSKFSLPKTLLASTLGFVFASPTFAAIPTTLKLDYAYYAPTSLVVKDQNFSKKHFQILKLNGFSVKAVTAH